MTEWWREAAWMMVSGDAWIHPQTTVENVPEGVRLTAHKVTGYSVTLPNGHPLAVHANTPRV